MFVEISYVHGACPLCGGRPTQINPLDSARDLLVNESVATYSNFVTYSARCNRCSLLWYVRTYSWIDENKAGHAVRRNYIDHHDYMKLKPMFIGMVNTDATLLEEEAKSNGSI